MRTKLLAGVIAVAGAAIVAVAVLVIGAGDGDDGAQAAIRTQSGLAVALASQNVGGDGAESASDQAALPASGQYGADIDVSASARSVDVKGGYGYAPAPLLQEGGGGITVQGYGSATATADSAVVEFYFSSSAYMEPDKPYPYPVPESGSDGTEPSIPPTPGEATPITEDTLKPVIDALKSAGVAADDIEFIGQQYPDPYYSSATLRAKVGDTGSLDGVVQAGQDAAAGLENVMLNSSSVSYTVSDCSALEKAAMVAAVEDANQRGADFAEALGVGLGEITGASNYSYSPYGGSVCGGGFYGEPYPMGGMPYYEGQASEVQVFANISVTFAIQ